MKALKSANPTVVFMLSALAFILANNWRFISSGSFLPTVFDVAGYVLFVVGLIAFFGKKQD